MLFDYLHPFKLRAKTRAEEHSLVKLHNSPHDTMEGAEFMDDALRFEDELPVMQTEVSIAAGSPEQLL
jgi:hypothetical protein